MKSTFRIGLALLGAAIAAVFAFGPAQRAIGQGMQQITNLAGTEQIPLNFPCTVSCYATSSTLSGYTQSLPGGNYDNSLIGGDATTNLFQRATTGSSVTTTLTYGGPDRWAYWSGTATAMTVSRDTTAADLPPSKTFQAAFKMARTSGQTGVLPVCMIQVVEGTESFAYSGLTAEVDFHATAGANFSAANSVMTVNFITGSVVDEGAAKAAFGLNGGGGGGSGWTTQANVTLNVTISATNTHYTAAAPIPAGTAEIAVALCFTPVGTAGTNDYIALSGIQLTRNSTLTTVAGSAGVVLPANDARAKAFARRGIEDETSRQQRYYYQLTESAAIAPVAPCAAVDTTHTNCLVQFPVTMRAAPTLSFANGFATPTSTTQATLGNCTTLAAATTVTSTVASTGTALVNCTAGTVPAAGVASFLYSNNGTGKIQASAEL
jgi:hypothetical protein